jgi:hypothetical protein
LININAGLFRSFTLSERWNLQFRGEAMNLSNTPHFAKAEREYHVVELWSDRVDSAVVRVTGDG